MFNFNSEYNLLISFVVVFGLSILCGVIARIRNDDFVWWAILHAFYSMLFLPFSLLIFAAMIFCSSQPSIAEFIRKEQKNKIL